METLALGLVNWLATVLLVESEVTRPIREWVDKRYRSARIRYPELSASNWAPEVSRHGWRTVLWYKARYFVGCQLCTGTWVGWILAALTIGWHAPLGTGILGIVLAGLFYKAIGHIVLIGQKLAERWSQ
jgi:hypothetical protein